MNEFEILLKRRSSDDNIAIVDGRKSVTYNQLCMQVESLAYEFQKIGLRNGSYVAIILPNSIEYITIYFSNNHIGIISVPIDYNSKHSTIAEMLKNCNTDFVITDVKKYQEIRPFFVDFNLNYIILKDGLKIESVLSDKIARPSFEKTADVSLVVHTTGTTGKKKGVVLTNNSLLEATKAINSIMRIPQRPIEIIAMPLSRSFGLARMRCVLMKNGTIIISRGLLNPALFIKNILDNKVSGFGLVPFGIRLLLPRFSKYLQDLSAQIDYIEMGSSPFSLTEKQNLQKLMPHTNIFMHYGLTEASRSTFINFKDKDNLASVGQPSPGVEIKIFGEDMQELGINQIGRIMIKSNWIFEGYIGEKTADSFYEGWFQTDDMGKIDEKGYLYFESRNSDLLNYRGYKFSPLEIEEVINKNPDVKCSCVAMTSSPGSKILAFVETKTRNNSTLKNLKNSCRKNLETYKVPSEIVAVKKIEKSDTGKIKRRYMVDKHAR